MLCGSLIWLMGATVPAVGIDNTSYEARDSRGRTMGFNDKLSLEHYAIILRNFRISSVFSLRYVSEWLLFAMHIVGILLVTGKWFESKLAKAFFLLQMFLLPVALFGAGLLVADAVAIPAGRMDREAFTDLPWSPLVSLPFWFVTCVFALYLMPWKTSKVNESLHTSSPTI
jgi:hypothetical protein